ncbi:MAG: hypothetical protein JST42_07845 [Bacteroidetes bacterium]|nr:hypothetical protein [Bacteroidota bacterium]
MSHLFIAALIVLTVTGILLILVIMHNNQIKSGRNSMLSFFRDIASVNNLSFTGQEVLQAMALGLDGPNRQLVIVEEKNQTYDPQIIDLREVTACRIKKVYTAIHSNAYKRSRSEDYLRSIALELDLKGQTSPVVVFFYRNDQNSIHEIRELETRVRNWEKMLSKMLTA